MRATAGASRKRALEPLRCEASMHSAWESVVIIAVSLAVAMTVTAIAGFIYASGKVSEAAAESKFRACVEHHPPLECSAALHRDTR